MSITDRRLPLLPLTKAISYQTRFAMEAYLSVSSNVLASCLVKSCSFASVTDYQKREPDQSGPAAEEDARGIRLPSEGDADHQSLP